MVRCRGASGVSLKIQQEKLVGNLSGGVVLRCWRGGEEHNMFNVSASFSTGEQDFIGSGVKNESSATRDRSDVCQSKP